MQIIPVFSSVASFCRPAVAALGAFDGVHAGHQALLAETVRFAAQTGRAAAVFTFTDDPGKGAPLLSEAKERYRLFEEAGISLVYTVCFSDICSLTPEEFVRDVLVGKCRILAAVCGFNFRFGRQRTGDAATLLSLLPESRVLAPVLYGGKPISSSRVRAALSAGDAEEAGAMLGRPYCVTAPVLHGKALGRTIGFPTVNMRPAVMLPAAGVYVTRLTVNGLSLPAMTDIGQRPTVENAGEYRMETYIPDFSEDLYGQTVSVAFLHRLRGEKKFEGLPELKAQLSRDETALRAFFKN